MSHLLNTVRNATWGIRKGVVESVRGVLIEAHGPDVAIGEDCEITPRWGHDNIRAQTVGFRGSKTLLMPYAKIEGIAAGCDIVATGKSTTLPVGDGLLGRVVDPFGVPLDAKGSLSLPEIAPLKPTVATPLMREKVNQIFPTGVRAIDSCLTLGIGQRVGIFAGSGVGKSTLLGMIARTAEADINVIALIGERGREVRDFVDTTLGPEALKKSVVIAAAADQSPPARVRAAYAATSIAEYFAQRGKHVMLVMDSLTRMAIAQREMGLAAGEPATARGYTPSVFAEIPPLIERCGRFTSGGAITAIYTVLLEGDDTNDPVADYVRASLDGHIVLDRELAQHGHYPAIDILQSISRLMPDFVDKKHLDLARKVVRLKSLYARSRDLIEVGAYRSGVNTDLDEAVRLLPDIDRFLAQDWHDKPAATTDTWNTLNHILGAVSLGRVK